MIVIDAGIMKEIRDDLEGGVVGFGQGHVGPAALATVRRRTVGSRGKGGWLRALITYVDKS